MEREQEHLLQDEEPFPTDEDAVGVMPEPGNPGGHIAADRVMTTSGEAPTGGIPVGGAADRIQPDDWAREHGSASGA